MAIDIGINTFVTRDIIATIDPSSSDRLSFDTGYIKASISFLVPDDLDGNKSTSDWLDVDDDIISLTTDQGTSKQEGDATAKMTITLNNNNMKYSGKLIPQMTLVASFIEVERNEVNGKMLNVVRETYPLYFGRVQEVSMNNETCTVECGDESSTMESSVEFDLTFFPTKTSKERIEEILDAMDPRPLLDVEKIDDFLKDATGESVEKHPDITIEGYTTSSQSAQSNTSTALKDMSLDWAVPSDQIGRLIILNNETVYRAGDDNQDLTAFTLDPSDGESIIGHCNVITVIADSSKDPEGTSKNVKRSNSTPTYREFKDDESITKYGRLESKVYAFPNLASDDQITNYGNNLLDLYKSYENRVLTPTIVSKIPMLGAKFNYSINGYGYNDNFLKSDLYLNSDVGEESKNTITVKMLRKQVSYDSSGVVCQLECKRWSEDLEAGEKIPEHWKRAADKTAEAEGASTWTLWMINPDTGVIRVYPHATQSEYESFMTDSTNPVDESEWNKQYVGDTPFGRAAIFPDESGSYVSKLV